MRSAFIEVRLSAAEISRITCFAWQFTKTPGNFAQRLRPATGGVRHQCNTQTLVTEIFADRNSRVNTGLPSCHRHIGCIGNYDSTLHQRPACARVIQQRKLVQYSGHFITALAAAYIDNDVCITPLGQCFLQYGLAGSKSAGHRGTPAAPNRKQAVQNTLPRKQRSSNRLALQNRPWLSYRPVMAHTEFTNFTVTAIESAQDLIFGVLTSWFNR